MPSSDVVIDAKTRASVTPASAAARRRVSSHGFEALISMLAPGVLFPIALFLVRHQPRFDWVLQPSRFPWELWVITVCGSIATAGGLLDWRFHRSGRTAVGKQEHASHIAALGFGGGTMFLLMCAASVIARPATLLLPIIIIALMTCSLICYDEFVFHRRCGTFETLTHRLLVFGNTIAWLAWMHWCYVRSGTIA